MRVEVVAPAGPWSARYNGAGRGRAAPASADDRHRGGVMKRLSDVIHGDLHWVQPRVFDRAFELRHLDEIVATLSFRSAFGSFATATSADGS